MGVDPSSAAEVGAALAQWVGARFEGGAHVAGPPVAISGGFDSYLHAVDLEGESLPEEWRAPLVVRLLPTMDRKDEARREADVQRWATEQGYSAPRVLEVIDSPEPFGLPGEVMERVPGATMLAAVSARPWRAPGLVDRLAGLALSLHALPTSDWPGAADPQAMIDQRLRLPRQTVATSGGDSLRRAIERMEEAMSAVPSGESVVVCHGDFHPLNVMVDDDRTWVLDWTDAGLGPPEADVARTLLLLGVVAPIAASSRVEQVALRVAGPWLANRYRRAYTAGRSLDARRMRMWDGLHALHGWSQVVSLHAGDFAGASSSDGQEDQIPLALAGVLEQRVEDALSP